MSLGAGKSPKGEKERVMSDDDLIVVGSGFAGSSATLAFCETAEREGSSGRVALLEVGKNRDVTGVGGKPRHEA